MGYTAKPEIKPRGNVKNNVKKNEKYKLITRKTLLSLAEEANNTANLFLLSFFPFT